MSVKRINFRCRPSTFRALLDSISEHFTKEVVEILRMLHIHQFIRMPATQQDSTDITLLMSCWNIEKQAFYVGGHYLPFTADEVALIIGMPNRGEKVTWQKSPLSESNSICFKNKIKKLDRPSSAAQFVQLYIQFLISNLFFIYHNYRVASDLISYADNIDKFANYNWPEAIWSFLVSQFDMITSKILTQKAPGYMSGFVTLLMIWFLEHTRVLSPTVPSAKPRMLRWSNIKFTEESISGLQGDQVLQSFEDITEDETWLLQTVFSIPQSFHIDPHRSASLSPRSEASIESPYISPRYSPPSYASNPPSATTPLGSDEKNEILSLIKALRDRLSYFEATITQRLDDIDARLAVIEARVGGQKNPNMGEAAEEDSTGAATEATHPEVSLETTLMKDEQLIVYEGPTSKIDVAQPSMGSIARSVKARQVRKRKIVSPSFTRVYRKTGSTSRLVVVSTPNAKRVEEGHHEMKRSFPWKTVDFISLSDSDSDSEGVRQDRAKRGKKDYSSKNLKDITSEGALIRMAGMYQDYMKRTPIPTFSGSVIPFTSWQGLAKSLKQLYGQPLHYLTNRLLKQWDRERFGSDDEHQPLDAVIHPLKAQTLIWLTEELHRLTASPHHLAELWASDPMYHSLIDPFLSC